MFISHLPPTLFCPFQLPFKKKSIFLLHTNALDCTALITAVPAFPCALWKALRLVEHSFCPLERKHKAADSSSMESHQTSGTTRNPGSCELSRPENICRNQVAWLAHAKWKAVWDFTGLAELMFQDQSKQRQHLFIYLLPSSVLNYKEMSRYSQGY